MIESFEITEVTYDDGKTVYFYEIDFCLGEKDKDIEQQCSMRSCSYPSRNKALIAANNYLLNVERDYMWLQKRTGINYGYEQVV